jgi:lipoate-protein ligase B
MTSMELLDLGTRPYPEVWDLQRSLVEARSRGEIPDTLILVEHGHVITLGRKTSPENFKPLDVPVFQVERGGDATYHGPGQLVGYPIIKMEVPDVRNFVRALEEVLILASRQFFIDAGRREKHTGVWVGEKKLASIGVAVTNWVTYHGFALNVNTEMSYFHLIRPCGLDPDTMTSMEELTGKELEMGSVKREVARSFSGVFGADLVEGVPPLRASTRSTS